MPATSDIETVSFPNAYAGLKPHRNQKCHAFGHDIIRYAFLALTKPLELSTAQREHSFRCRALSVIQESATQTDKFMCTEISIMGSLSTRAAANARAALHGSRQLCLA